VIAGKVRARRALVLTSGVVAALAVCLPAGAHRDQAETGLARPELSRNVLAFYSRFGPREAKWRWDVLTHVSIFAARLHVDPKKSAVTVQNTAFWRSKEVDSIRAAAHRHGAKVLLTITNFVYQVGFSGRLAHDVVGTRETRDAAVRAILREAFSARHGDGVVIDFERLDSQDSGNFTMFVAALAKAVHAATPGAEVFVAVGAQNQRRKFDVPRLAAASDGIFLMSYLYHSKRSGPGPVSPLSSGSPWRRSIDLTIERYVGEGAPARKLIPAMRLGGNDWPATSPEPGARRGTGRVRGVPYAKFRRLYLSGGLERRWNKASQTPYITYRASDGQWHQIWVDDNQSARLKLSFVKQRGLWGLGLWGLGREDDSLWTALREPQTRPRRAAVGH
jgi:spore germination protein YaaH